jgi:hypothetical protein
MNKAFRIGTVHGALLVGFEFLLVLNHNDVTWGCSKNKDVGKKRFKKKLNT